MAELEVPDPEELLMCPYDKVHMVRAKRFQYHLMKCRKNWPGAEYAMCPFNAKHEMPKPELRYHMATCMDRAVLEKDIAFEKSRMNGEGTLFKGCTDVPAYSGRTHCDESWDLEINTCPRIGVEPEFFEKFKYIDISGYNNEQKKSCGNQTKPGGQTVRHHITGKNPGPGKLRLPQNESQASKLSEFHRPVQHQSNVFAYSLSMAGLGRGKGKAVEQPSVVPSGSFNMGLGRGVMPIGIREMMTDTKEENNGGSSTNAVVSVGGLKDVILLKKNNSIEATSAETGVRNEG